MGARILDGRSIAQARNEATRRVLQAHRAAAGRRPRLDVLLVGDDAASGTYVRRKESAATKLGIEARVHRLPGAAGHDEIARHTRELAGDSDVDGIVLQLPLPEGIDPRPLFALIPPEKDVDGLHPVNQGRLLQGRKDLLVPATPLAIAWIIEAAGIKLRALDVTIVSHSNLIGKPLAALLVNEDATVTICHKHTKDLKAHTQRADLLITAAGVPGLITAEHVRPGATVIDAAIVSRPDGTLVGDCAPDAVEHAAAITPVPGGVGPVTVAALLSNTVTAWASRTRTPQAS